MSNITLPSVRYLTENDVYHYSVDNRPLQDLASRDQLLADNLNAVLNLSGLGTGVTPIANGGTAGTTAVQARTNLGAASSGANADISTLGALTATPLVVSQDIQNNVPKAATTGGTSDAITASFTPAITTLVNGMSLHVRASNANGTTTPTFTPNSGTVSPRTIIKGNNLPLAVNDIPGAGYWMILEYDSAFNAWVLLNPAQGVFPFSFSVNTILRSSGDTPLLLDRFDIVHKYVTGSSNTINVTTQMVDGGIYEVYIDSMSINGAINFDLCLYPNNTSYPTEVSVATVNTWDTSFTGTAASAGSTISPQSRDYFFFDSMNGYNETCGSAKLTLFPHTSLYKKVLGQTGSTTASGIHSGVWANTTAAWTTIGRITLYSPGSITNMANINSVITIKRIA